MTPSNETYEGSSEELTSALARELHWPPHRLVLESGIDFEPRVKPTNVKAGKSRCCFANAFRLASADSALRYVEGFGNHPKTLRQALPHAWCIDSEERVIDPTWCTETTFPSALRGVVLPLDLVSEYAVDESYEAIAGMTDDERFADLLAAIGVEWDEIPSPPYVPW